MFVLVLHQTEGVKFPSSANNQLESLKTGGRVAIGMSLRGCTFGKSRVAPEKIGREFC